MRRKLVAILVCGAMATAALGTVAGSAGAETTVQHENVTVSADKDFTRANGFRSGMGTREDPYVFSGWQIGSLVIQNTDRYVTIRDNTIGGLVLDWIGNRVIVRNNSIGDMRVNQNVARTGRPTSGNIEWNAFGVVGQLRHWDGLFQYNVVGAKVPEGQAQTNQAVNFDGFNGAKFVHNTIYGFVDARLHGHHHSTKFGSQSHNHTMNGDYDHSSATEKTMHRYRHHQVTIAGNKIYSDAAYAIQYLDTDHATNDRTAASETDPALEAPHLHFTRVSIAGNRLYGSGILINVFNALDDRHPWTERGSIDIRGNAIHLGKDSFLDLKQLQGIEVRQARDVNLRIIGNSVTGKREESPLVMLENYDEDAGIFLNTLDDASVSVIGNRVSTRAYGVRAATMTKTVVWRVRDLRTTNVRERVHYDDSVENKPKS
jgi:hypothetical protein